MARTSNRRSSRLTGRKGPNAVGNLHPNIHRHKARPHDMHAGSNALQQRFSKQPVNAQGRPLVKLATACRYDLKNSFCRLSKRRPGNKIKILFRNFSLRLGRCQKVLKQCFFYAIINPVMSEDIADNVFKSILEKNHGRYFINGKYAF